MPRPILILALLGVAACSGETNHTGNRLTLPIRAPGSDADNADDARRRGQVELFVKTHHTELIDEILGNGGPQLTEAMALAGIPDRDRPARLIQLRADAGLHAANPGALVVALLVYGQ